MKKAHSPSQQQPNGFDPQQFAPKHEEANWAKPRLQERQNDPFKRALAAREGKAMETDDFPGDTGAFLDRYPQATEPRRWPKYLILILLLGVVGYGFWTFLQTTRQEKAYQEALVQLKEQKFLEAATGFKALGDFEDSAKLEQQAVEGEFELRLGRREVEEAKQMLSLITDPERKEALQLRLDHLEGVLALEQKEYLRAEALLSKIDGLDEATKKKLQEIQIPLAIEDLNARHFYEAARRLEQAKAQGLGEAEKILMRLYGNQLRLIEATEYMTAAIRKDGAVYDSVYVTNQELWKKGKEEARAAVSLTMAQDLLLRLSPNGKVQVQQGAEGDYEAVKNWENIAMLAASEQHILGLQRDGKVLYHGSDANHKAEVDAWVAVKAVYAGKDLSLALMEDRTLRVAGARATEFEAVTGWSNIASLAVGETFVAALTEKGEVLFAGQIEEETYEPEWKNIVAISAGSSHLLALDESGKVYALGDNTNEQIPENWTEMTAIAAGKAHSIGLKKDGTLVAIGGIDTRHTLQLQVSDYKDIALPLLKRGDE